jgi:hypothetical protein
MGPAGSAAFAERRVDEFLVISRNHNGLSDNSTRISDAIGLGSILLTPFMFQNRGVVRALKEMH